MMSQSSSRAAGLPPLRLVQLGLCVGALLGARLGAAAELDARTGLLTPDAGAVMIGFEDPAQLATLGAALTKYQTSGSGYGATATLVFVDAGGTAMTADELAAHVAPDAAVEGAQALLLGAGPTDGASGVLIPWSAVAAKVTAPRVRVTVWVRSNGATPTLTATYSTATTLPADGSFTSVTAIRTGRETSDGWAELTTGPIDTSIWGVPLAQLFIGLSGSDARRNTTATLVVDALEIAPVAGAAFVAHACTIATQEADCGADGECQFGHCLPAYASWGPTPSAAHRAEFVDRWIAIGKNIHAARNVPDNAQAMEEAREALTAPTVGGRQFYSSMIGFVNGLRNHHTSFGEPANLGLLQPLAAGYSSTALGVCLGFGELDLIEDPGEQRLGFIVYKVADGTSVVGVPLKVGDAVTAIDGIDPLTWVRSVYLTWAAGVPADPGADLAWSAASVAWMISHRATSVEITRCASATDCTGDNRSVFTVDVSGPAWANLEGTGLLGNETDPNILDCAERFHDALSNIPAAAGYSDAVTTQTIWTDVLGVQFDGTLADFAAWEGQVVAGFPTAKPPTKVLFDVRQGNGGYAQNSEIIAEEIRPTSQPVGEVDFPTTTWDRSDTVTALMAIVNAASPSCRVMNSEMGAASAPCDLLGEYFLGDYYAQAHAEESTVTAFTANGLDAKVAWLQAADVSANDYLAALVSGRTNQRVFGPGPTSGSYGTISSIAPLLLGWRGGSIQMTDSVWGTSPGDLATRPFLSGVGIQPDVVVAQRMSDAINDVDTMLAAAQAWLEE